MMVTRFVSFLFTFCTKTIAGMEILISQRKFKEAFDLVIQEIEDDLESKEDLKELFVFVLKTYW